MRKIGYIIASLFATLLTSCGDEPCLTRMKCEYVADKDTAYIYGKSLNSGEIHFQGPGSKFKPAEKIAELSNDTMAAVIVPTGSRAGRIKLVTSDNKEYRSPFVFRDNRNIIIDFDQRVATWGGYDPIDDENDGFISMVKSVDDSVLYLPCSLPEQISDRYGFLYGIYSKPWTMSKETYLQYVANKNEGGRGRISIAGEGNEGMSINELCLKFEIYIPKEVPYTRRPRVEIFFGPYDSPDKHGREISPICTWEPYIGRKDGYYTDGWETVTIPLTEFKHDYRTDDKPFDKPLDLKKATNLAFVVFGDPGDTPAEYFICIDNLRVVSIN